MAIWGISYSGGHVLAVGAADPRVKCIVSIIPVVGGYENMRRAHGTMGFRKLMETVIEHRAKRFQQENYLGYIPMSAPDPDQVLCTWPFPETYKAFIEIQESEAPRHEHRNTVESVELLMTYNVFPYAKRILNIPTLMVVAEGDDLTLWDREIEAFNQIASPQKKLFIIPQTSHMKLYSSRANLEIAAKMSASWLVEGAFDQTL